ncbi:uncharacterized protein LOC142776473 [Rhipicephalus microplus]|uniref:uncharacterized protein LOC142776473 n=1 Tax=Rhipicephalus microplus TaxID=6941 RepID=UPI003F6A9A50
MATFNILQGDLVICPYICHHKVKRGRLSIHVSKCRRDGRRLQRKPCPFNPDHDAPAEPDGYLQHLATCPDKTTMLLCTQTSDDPPYEVPAPGGAQPFHHEPDEQWVAEPARACISPVTECERPPGGTCLPCTRSRQPHVPAACVSLERRAVVTRNVAGITLANSNRRQNSNQASVLYQIEQPYSQQAPQAQSHASLQRLGGRLTRDLVAPQATKASPPSLAQALATHEQSNQASKRYVCQVPLNHNDRPRSTKAGKPSASQATQPVIDYPKNPSDCRS